MNPLRTLGLVVEPDAEHPLSSLFHRLSRIIRDDQELSTLPANTAVSDALRFMEERGFSQVPIREGREIVGVFSYRSFAVQSLRFKDPKILAADLTIGDFAEDLPFVSPSDPFDEVIDKLDRCDALLLGTTDNAVAIVTPMDILRYLYGATSPYVLVAEIELAIRALMSRSIGGGSPSDFFERCLRNKYAEKLPGKLDELTFEDYQLVITYGDNWPSFKDAFGSTATSVRTKLQFVGKLRNALFHFRRGITMEEYAELADIRTWLLRRSRILEGKGSARA